MSRLNWSLKNYLFIFNYNWKARLTGILVESIDLPSYNSVFRWKLIGRSSVTQLMINIFTYQVIVYMYVISQSINLMTLINFEGILEKAQECWLIISNQYKPHASFKHICKYKDQHEQLYGQKSSTIIWLHNSNKLCNTYIIIMSFNRTINISLSKPIFVLCL